MSSTQVLVIGAPDRKRNDPQTMTAHYRVAYALHPADHAMGTVFDAALRPLSITAAQAGVLLHLDR